MSVSSDRRQFERFSIDFKIEVVAYDIEGREHKEKTTLEEISGEGARFLTGKAGRYFIEQSLEVSIYLPGTDEVKASMRGKARVMRIEPCSNAASSGEAQSVCVAVKLDAPLYFERYSAL
jgi:hypothetical protein